MSDHEALDGVTTPTRSSKKRGRVSEVNSATSRNTRRKMKDTREADREDTEGTEPQEPSDEEQEPTLPTEDDIIAHLKVAERQVNATEDFANDLLEGQENVPGYGKIAGRDWAFIIRKVEVNIGRPEAQERLQADEYGGHTATGPTARTVVDIDLGPDRQVSRSHAIIFYDSEKMQWLITVNGRNGLRVDNNLLKRGSRTYLRSGSVIEIANTQMAFITTATKSTDGPIWDQSIIRQAQKSSEDDDDGDVGPGSGRDIKQNLRPAAAGGPLQGSSMNGTGNDTNPGPSQQHPPPPGLRATGNQNFPGTPSRSQLAPTKSSPAANYSRGVMMESTETIDYSADGAKDLKPPHSYAQLIGMAILSTNEQQMTLSNIYKWIMANYAFYRFNTGGWQNSIRHNLSLNKAFTKIARRTDEPGKGMKWMIEPTEFENFVQQGMKGCRRPNPMHMAPNTVESPQRVSPANMSRALNGAFKRGDDATPPLGAYKPNVPHAADTYTPDRGPLRAASANGVGLGINGEGPEYDFLTRSTPRNSLTAIANAIGSPPALYGGEEARALDTPFPLRPNLRPAPPSTLRRPSDYIQFSSPAPFWKMEGLVGSTPFKPYDLSPLKTPFPAVPQQGNTNGQNSKGAVESDDDEKGEQRESTRVEQGLKVEKKRDRSPLIASSSPPRPSTENHGLDASPTVSRTGTTAVTTRSHPTAATKQEETGASNVSNDPADGVVESGQTAVGSSSNHPGATSGLKAHSTSRAQPLPQLQSNGNHAYAHQTNHNGGPARDHSATSRRSGCAPGGRPGAPAGPLGAAQRWPPVLRGRGGGVRQRPRAAARRPVRPPLPRARAASARRTAGGRRLELRGAAEHTCFVPLHDLRAGGPAGLRAGDGAGPVARRGPTPRRAVPAGSRPAALEDDRRLARRAVADPARPGVLVL